MTPEDIKKAREIIAGANAPYERFEEGFVATLDFLQASRAGWPEALDEVERLQAEIADLKTAMKNDIALYKEIMTDVRADELQKLRAVAVAAEACEKYYTEVNDGLALRGGCVPPKFYPVSVALKAWRAKK